MSTRPIMITTLLAAGLLAGCGPTKAGLEARARARDRLNVVNAQLSYDQASQALDVGQFEKATKEVNRAIRLHPTWAEYRVLQGRIYLETHRLENAIHSFETALELKPDYPEAHYYCGIVYQRWSDDSRAYDHYMSAFEQAPDSVAYLLAAAESLVALNQLAAAEHLINSKITYFEHNSALRHLQGQIALLQDLSEVERPELIRLEAQCLAALDRQTEARNLFLKLSHMDPTNTELWIELGSVAWEIGDYHRLALCGSRITALAPDRFEGYMLKGVNERHHGNLSEAVQFLREAGDRAEKTALPHLLLGRVLEQTGEPEAALEAYAQAVRIDPGNEEAQILWGEGQRRLMVAQPGTDGARNE